MIKSLVILLIILIGFHELHAQQDAQYTQYMYNTNTINPAYAGSRRVLSITALHRSQWLGLDGAPTTQTLNISFPGGKRIGLAASILNDEILNGIKTETDLKASVSYTIKAGEQSKLAFGLNFGGNLLSLNFSELEGFIDEQSSITASNIDKQFSPNFGAGIYYYTDKFYLGFSAPDFLETEYFDGSAASTSYLISERIGLHLITGKVFDLNQNLQFKPTLLLRAVIGTPLKADFSANFLMNETFALGAAYRWGSGISALSSFQINEQFLLGIAYDRETTAIGNTSFNAGSFELFLRFELPETCNCTWKPRFF
jgi:type IX secretion system PorP/SprF family membrane protein